MAAKAERVTLPRLFDAILRLLFLFAAVATPDAAVEAFVLDFSDEYWQIPLIDDEGKYLAFLRRKVRLTRACFRDA